MTAKNIAVRLVAEGGRAVRAEFEGIAGAAEQSFGKTGREADRASARLAEFGRRAKVAAAATAAAMVAAAAAAVRSGLQVVDAQAKLAQSLNTTVESMQVLERAGQLAGVSLGQIEQAAVQMTRRLSQAAAGTGPAVDALQRLNLEAAELAGLPLDERIARVQEAIERFIPPAQRAAVASQIFGDRAGVMFARIDTETLRTATRDVREFGVAVSESDARQIERTNDALSRLSLIWRGLANQLAVAVAPTLERVAEGLAAVARQTGPLGRAIVMLVDNFGRLVAIGGTAAAFFAGRFALSVAAGAAAVVRLTASVTALRALLARTLPGALIIGVGEIVARVSGLAGVSAEAERAIDNLSIALGDEHRALSSLAPALATGTRMSLEQARAKLQEVRTRRENIAAIIEETRALAMQTGEFRAVQREVDGITQRIRNLQNTERDGGRFAPLARRGPGFQGAAGVAGVDDLMRDLQDAARRRGEILGAGGDQRAALAEADEQIRRLTEAIETATDGVVTMGESMIPTLELTDRLAGNFRTAGGAARGAGQESAEAAEAAAEGWRRVAQSLDEYASSAMDLASQLGESLVGAFRSAENAIADFVKTGKLDFRSLATSIIADLARIAARRFILGPIANALSGALGGLGGAGIGAAALAPVRSFDRGGRTGWGARAGGLDGLGGFLALIHPQERIVDESRGRGRADAAPVYVTINTRDAESFRQSRAQVQADIARAVQAGRRGL